MSSERSRLTAGLAFDMQNHDADLRLLRLLVTYAEGAISRADCGVQILQFHGNDLDALKDTLAFFLKETNSMFVEWYIAARLVTDEREKTK